MWREEKEISGGYSSEVSAGLWLRKRRRCQVTHATTDREREKRNGK